VKEKPTTLRMLAALAGVSAMTISLALRNHRSISPATTKRVQQLARTHGYRRDPEIAKLMLHLRARRTQRIQSSICALTTIRPLRDALYARDIAEAARKRANHLGYAYDQLCLSDYQNNPAQLHRVLRSRGVEGVLLLPMAQPLSVENLIDWRDFSVVAASYSVTAPHFHRVIPHHFDNVLLVCRQLKQRGYERVGLITTPAMEQRGNNCYAAAVLWHNAYGGVGAVKPLIAPMETLTPDFITNWIKANRVDAVITNFERLVLPAAERLRKEGYGEIAMAKQTLPISPLIAGVDEKPDQIGRTAVDLLDGLLQRGEKGLPDLAKVTMIAGEWKEGTSVRSATKPSPTKTTVAGAAAKRPPRATRR
jgi:DNA-binding LacI/PurR family transcriptional regulator